MSSDVKSIPVTRPPSPFPGVPKLLIPRTKEKRFEPVNPDLLAPRNTDRVNRVALEKIEEGKK